MNEEQKPEQEFEDPHWTIIKYPDDRLTDPQLEDVTVFDDEFHFLAGNLLKLMYMGQGVGLAAPQVGWNKRVIAVDITGPAVASPVVLVNPTILSYSIRTAEYPEGCLSFPGLRAKIRRPAEITLEAYTVAGEKQTITVAASLARVVQHEVDHLEGRLFIEHMSPAKKAAIKSKLARARGELGPRRSPKHRRSHR